MTKAQKAEAVEEITSLLENVPTIYLTNYSGLTVEQVNELRNRFRDSGVTYRVLKNTLVRLAMEKLGGYDHVFESLHGPTAIAFSEEPAAPARVIKKFLSDTKGEIPELKAAHVDGSYYGPETLEILASLKSKDDLIADIIGLLLSPIQSVLGGIQAPGQNVVGALKTIAEKES